MTTGSLVLGCVQGMALGLGGGGVSGIDIGEIVNVTGNPSGVLIGIPNSGIAWDGENSQHYMVRSGTEWIKLGSVA